MVQLVKSMYEGARTTVRSSIGNTGKFEIRVGVHQGSCLSPLLFIIVMDAVSEHVGRDVPWDILIVADETKAELQTLFTDWQRELESKELRISIDKTETMVCSRTTEKVVITDTAGKGLKQTDTFKYLGSLMNAQGGCEHDIRNRIKIAWQKWRELTGVLCDTKMPIRLKGKIYKTMIRPVMLYGAEAWAMTRREEEILERAEMKMLRWMLGISLREKKRNEYIREKLGVVCVTDKMREIRLRWYGHVMRKEDDNCTKRIMKAEVYGKRSRGRPRKRWSDMIRNDMKMLNLKDEDILERDEKRRRIRVADPSAVGD